MAVRSLLDVLFPSRCVGCGRTGDIFCDACRPRDAAARRLRARHGLPVVAAGAYAGVLRRAILAYKRGRRDAGDALCALFVERVAALVPAGVLLVPVPTTRARRRRRGFDQTVGLARALERRTGAPVVAALAHAAGGPQRGRSRAERLAARDRFACVSPRVVAGARIVLVDDVMTTGATLDDCAATLARGGAVVVAAAVLAYA